MSNEKNTNENHWKVLVLLLKDKAKKDNIKPYEISKQIGVSASTVTRIFNLEFCPKFQLIIDIAKTLSLDVKIIEKK